MSELALNSNTIKLEKGKNSKLREWYQKNCSVTKDKDQVRKFYTTSLDVQNAVGSILVSVFAPYLLPLVPAAKKIAKNVRLQMYDAIKKGIDDRMGVEVENVETPSEGLLNQNELNGISKAAEQFLSRNQNQGRSLKL